MGSLSLRRSLLIVDRLLKSAATIHRSSASSSSTNNLTYTLLRWVTFIASLLGSKKSFLKNRKRKILILYFFDFRFVSCLGKRKTFRPRCGYVNGGFCRCYSNNYNGNIDLSNEESKRRLFNRWFFFAPLFFSLHCLLWKLGFGNFDYEYEDHVWFPFGWE